MCSIALVVLSREGIPIESFAREHLRLVDSATQRELMIYPHQTEGLPDLCAWLVGGLVNWAFHTALKRFAFKD
jgi:hypothetical protein